MGTAHVRTRHHESAKRTASFPRTQAAPGNGHAARLEAGDDIANARLTALSQAIAVTPTRVAKRGEKGEAASTPAPSPGVYRLVLGCSCQRSSEPVSWGDAR